MEVIHTSPTLSQFTLLSDFQSQTPESFHSGPAVLYHHSLSAMLKLHASELDASPTLSTLATDAQRIGSRGQPAVNGDRAHNEEDAEEDEQVQISGIDIWITSEYVRLSPYSTAPAHTTDHRVTQPDASYSTPPPSKPASQYPTPP